MRLSANSIRSKVWLCVLIALLGYFAATLVGFSVHITQYQRLTHLQQQHLPLFTLSDRAVNTFERQAQEYEDAFVTGELELLGKADEYTERLIRLLDSLSAELATHPNSPMSVQSLQHLKDMYTDYIQLAHELEAVLELEDFSLEVQRDIQQFSKTQQALLLSFRTLATNMNNSLQQTIEQHKSKSLSSMVLLAALFVLVLLLVALMVGRVSRRLLVAPLSALQHNIERFELGQDFAAPQHSARDEIGQLVHAFWSLSQRLTRSMVSKRYVDNIISNMSGALVVLRPNLTIDKVNQQTVKLFGYSEADLVGKTLSDVITASTEPLVCQARLEELSRGQTIRNADGRVVNKAGQEIPVHFSGSAMYGDNGQLTGIICVFNDITELKEAEEKLKRMAHHDPLTGLPNRNLFFDRLERALLDGKRHGRIFALLYLDLDKFKPINDTLGHDFGDLALKEVSNRLLAVLRGDDTVARVGGDEFIIILNGLSTPDSAYKLAEKVLDSVASPLSLGSLSHQLGVSVGVSVFPQDGTSMDTLIAKADAAMYRAKNSGGNAYCATDTDAVGGDS